MTIFVCWAGGLYMAKKSFHLTGWQTASVGLLTLVCTPKDWTLDKK